MSMTRKQLGKTTSKHVWGYIKAGAVTKPSDGVRWPGLHGQKCDHKIYDQTDPTLRCFEVNGDSNSTYDGYLPETLLVSTMIIRDHPTHWMHKTVDSFSWFEPEEIEFVKFKPVPKSFRTQATKNSRWKFKEDWVAVGYDGTAIEVVVPEGTEITITNNKMPMKVLTADYHHQSVIEIKCDQTLADMFASHGYYYAPFANMLPIKAMWDKLELVESGAERVYWIVENDNGDKLLTKRYVNLGNVKAALRMRGGLNKQSGPNDDADEDNYVPEWAESENVWGTSEFPIDKGVMAVKYNHGTDQMMEREDMLEYMTMAKLSS